MEAFPKLKRKEQLFLETLVKLGVNRNGAEAARQIWPKAKQPKNVAARLMARPEVKAALEELKAAALAKARDAIEDVGLGMLYRAEADRTAILNADGTFISVDKWPAEIKACVESLEFDDKGRLVKVRMSNRNDAARLWMQWAGELKSKHEHSGKDGAPLPPAATVYVISGEEAKVIGDQLDKQV